MADDVGSVFVTYSHDDSRHKDRLLQHLQPAVREGQLKVWEDSQLKAGDEWHAAIQEAIRDAKVAIALVSASFLASEYVAKHELPALLQAREREGLILIPVVVGACDYQASLLQGIQAANAPDKPLDQKDKAQRDKVWRDVARRVKESLAPGEVAQTNPLDAPGANEPTWSRMGGDQLLGYAVELSKLGRYDELLEIATELNKRELYDLASSFGWHATTGKEHEYAAWFERAFALAHLGRQEEAIGAFRRAYELQTQRTHHLADMSVPAETRIVAFAGAGSGRHYHGMGLTPDAVLTLSVGGSIAIIGNLHEKGTILDSPANRLTIYVSGMGGESRWVGLAYKFEAETREARQAFMEASLAETSTSTLVDIGAALNMRQRYFDAVMPLSEAIRRENSNASAWFEYAYALAHDDSRKVEAIAAFMHTLELSGRQVSGRKAGGATRIAMPDPDHVSVFTGIGGGAFFHALGAQPRSVRMVMSDGSVKTITGDSLTATTVHVAAMGDRPWIGMASK